MSERVGLTVKKPEVNRDNSDSQMQRTYHSRSVNPSVDRILFLQRTIGNQAVQRLIKSGALQAKLRIGQPGDVYEQEADRVADEVMRMPEPGVQRQVGPEEEEEEILQTKPLVDQITPVVQRQVEEEEEEEMLQAKSREDATPEVSNDLESQINAIKGGGKPLAESERAYFEPRFGVDFSQVRVHTGPQAAESARAVNARAFTVGQNLVFGAGQYTPQTQKGKRLLAHELTHVVQQAVGTDHTIWRNVRANSVCTPNVNNAPGNPIDQLRQIDAEAQRMAGGSALLLDFVSIDPAIFPTVTTAYRRFFGDPPAVTGGFRSRFDGQIHATQVAALREEMADVSENFRRINAALARDIRYRCTGTRENYVEECTIQCGPRSLAFACAGIRMSSIAICPMFWDPGNTLQMRAGYLIHEAVHARLNTRGHPDPFLGRRGGPGCYENFVAEVYGFGATDNTCAAKF